MQVSILVTVKGPRRALDVELPGDVPIGELLPLLEQMCGMEQPARPSSLSNAASGKQLPPALTLLDSGILTGDMLLLQARERAAAPTPSAPTQLPGPVAPSEQTGMIGVSWEKDWFS